ncbi:allophanate hydrolase-related protein [Streptomyces sp. TRM 70361]|uniref:allophanate hydrolase-related protein n=1 Tax=Streptomyces sp. TRM 70361 TaxID=3116553 RepID=UPI003FCC4F1F
MTVGPVELADGERVPGFLCEPLALAGAPDITVHGGWRGWRPARIRAPPGDRLWSCRVSQGLPGGEASWCWGVPGSPGPRGGASPGPRGRGVGHPQAPGAEGTRSRRPEAASSWPCPGFRPAQRGAPPGGGRGSACRGGERGEPRLTRH